MDEKKNIIFCICYTIYRKHHRFINNLKIFIESPKIQLQINIFTFVTIPYLRIYKKKKLIIIITTAHIILIKFNVIFIKKKNREIHPPPCKGFHIGKKYVNTHNMRKKYNTPAPSIGIHMRIKWLRFFPYFFFLFPFYSGWRNYFFGLRDDLADHPGSDAARHWYYTGKTVFTKNNLEQWKHRRLFENGLKLIACSARAWRYTKKS